MSQLPTLIVRDRRFREHVGAPGHPECPDRLAAIDRALEARPELGREVPPQPADPESICAVHAATYYERLAQLSGQHAQLDADTYLSPRSFEVASLAAGAAQDLAGRIVGGESRTGFALVRPPGHHAERSHAMGFCLFNQVAIVAQQLRRAHGVERIAIVDWDVHHGNGTQHAFESERDVLFVSTHQYPFYPGTGALGEMGQGAGEGATVNLPMPAGCGDSEYGAVFSDVVVPVLDAFRPEILLISAGFDAHAHDPLASMQVSTNAYAEWTRMLQQVAMRHCEGRMLFLLEGGYHLEALPASVVAVLETLAGESVAEQPKSSQASPRARQLVAVLREAHSQYWKSLATPIISTGSEA